MAKKKWIKDAINPKHKGEFKEKAERAGKTTREYSAEKEDAPGKLGKQARLAATLMKVSKRKSSEEKAEGRYGKGK